MMQFLNARELDQVHFGAALELQQRLDRTRDPGLPVTPADELRATFDDDASENARHERIVAFADTQAVAIGHLELTRDPANASLAINTEMGFQPSHLMGCWQADRATLQANPGVF